MFKSIHAAIFLLMILGLSAPILYAEASNGPSPFDRTQNFAVIGNHSILLPPLKKNCQTTCVADRASIAKNAPDAFGKLLAVGITAWLGLQFFVNIAAMTKLIPLTGIPMPLISYGGSSTVFSLMGLGILANISSQSYAKA